MAAAIPAPMRKPALLLLLACLALLLQGCAVKLVSDYDEVTDQAVMALQRKTTAHLLGLQTLASSGSGCKYEKHLAFYEEAKADASAIEVRAAALPDNQLETQQVQLLANSLESLEQLHRIGCLSPEQIKPLLIQFNVQFTSILRFELARRRGN